MALSVCGYMSERRLPWRLAAGLAAGTEPPELPVNQIPASATRRIHAVVIRRRPNHAERVWTWRPAPAWSPHPCDVCGDPGGPLCWPCAKDIEAELDRMLEAGEIGRYLHEKGVEDLWEEYGS